MAKDTKQHILEKSLVLFLQKGYNGVSMNDIVKATEMTKGAFYYYFDSKMQVFEEVVNYFYGNILDIGHNEYDTSSLKNFCNDIFEKQFKRLQIFEKQNLKPNEKQSLNQYFLIFDAISQMPTFRKKFNESDQSQLELWKKVINRAKKTKEITTTLSSEQIAKMFMYMGDGFGMGLILMNKNMTEMKQSLKNLKSLMDGLYQLLKNDAN